MNKLPQGLLLAALAASFFVVLLPTGAAAAPTVKFGMDSESIAWQSNAGVKPDYGTFWVGPWTLTSGWSGPNAELAKMKSAGVTPAVHLYYWGDDITPTCVEKGCWSSLHNAQKSRSGWNTLTSQLTQSLNSQMGGKPVVVFLESEFNKGGIATYEPFDGYMADMAYKINREYPAAIVVIGFGNWDSGNWHVFDRAVRASEMSGIQAMRGSTRDSASHYDGVYADTLAGVQKLKSLFGKPVMLTDLALSSYPSWSHEAEQNENLGRMFSNLGALKAAGVQSIIYRSWKDSPSMDTANYYGEAERHWGLAKGDGSLKPAGKAWVAGVKAERAGQTAPAPGGSTPTSGTSGSTVTLSPSGNEWWLQVGVQSGKAVAKVEAKVGSGAFTTMDKQSYGYTKSMHAARGATVTFKVTATDGSVAQTSNAWLNDMGSKSATYGGSGATSTAPASSSSGSFSASFSPKAVGNDWWIETGVSGSQGIAKVEAKVGGGAYQVLPKTNHGTYAKSIHAPNGSQVTLLATSTSGATATHVVTWT